MPRAIAFHQNDGGRSAAGFKGIAGDCAVRAFCIATGQDYADAYKLFVDHGRRERASKKRRCKSHPRTGVYGPTMRRIMANVGWVWRPTMGIGTGCRVHLCEDELPGGRLIVSLSHHYAAVIDWVLHDTHDSSRDGTRCVYGYWAEE